jgi:hypothetical protein
MPRSDRRKFLKQSVAAVSALAASRCTPPRPEPEASGVAAVLQEEALTALGRVVLPISDLGEEGVARVVADFKRWADAFEPVAELNHGYLTSEIDYAPADPRPRWAAQLAAIELEARKRHDASFPRLDDEDKLDLVRRSIENDPLAALADTEGDPIAQVPNASRAHHVGVGLVMFFYSTSEANDLCYRTQIGRYTCRGLDTIAVEPAPIEPIEEEA